MVGHDQPATLSPAAAQALAVLTRRLVPSVHGLALHLGRGDGGRGRHGRRGHGAGGRHERVRGDVVDDTDAGVDVLPQGRRVALQADAAAGQVRADHRVIDGGGDVEHVHLLVLAGLLLDPRRRRHRLGHLGRGITVEELLHYRGALAARVLVKQRLLLSQTQHPGGTGNGDAAATSGGAR